MSETKNQIVLTQDDLESLSMGIHQIRNHNFEVSHISHAIALLMKVESTQTSLDEVYDDAYLLELTDLERESVITYLSQQFSSVEENTRINLLISRNIRKGTAIRS